VKAAVAAVAASRPEPEIAAALSKINPATLATALTAAQDAAQAFDSATKSINKTSDQLDEVLMAGDKNTFRSFVAARLRYMAARYDNEARLNQAIAGVYELQVRQNNLTAERHHRRSGKFFFGMLAAQLAVIVSTFSIAARKKSFLWSLAAAAGMVAVSFATYVYFCV
jgi:hypothetical protein